MIWDPCFEDANFTLNEQVEAWLSFARGKQDVKADTNEVQAAVRENISQPPSNKKGEALKFNNIMEAMDSVHRKFSLPKASDYKPDFARHLALLHGDKITPIMRVIEHCIRMALLASLYGAAQSDGGFGKPNVQE